nr:tyrosine-protein kinase Drl-like [Aedes albopictus]
MKMTSPRNSVCWRFVLLQVLNLLQLSHGYFDLFLNHSEVIKLMGIEADLFYVRDGAINDYAISFVVPMKTGTDDLQFSWQSRTSYPLAYTISVHLDDNEGALQHPELNIPSSGAIPRSVETFKIHLVCNGNVTAEVPVGIHLHVEGPPKQNDTKLIIKRNKICIKGECSFLHVFRRIGLVFHLGAIGGRYRVLSVCMSPSMNANCCRFSWRSFGWLDERGDVRGLFTLH